MVVLPFGNGTTDLLKGNGRANQGGHQNLVYALARYRDGGGLSAKLRHALARGLDGMGDQHGKNTLEHAAWRAGHDIFEEQRAIRCRDPVREKK